MKIPLLCRAKSLPTACWTGVHRGFLWRQENAHPAFHMASLVTLLWEAELHSPRLVPPFLLMVCQTPPDLTVQCHDLKLICKETREPEVDILLQYWQRLAMAAQLSWWEQCHRVSPRDTHPTRIPLQHCTGITWNCRAKPTCDSQAPPQPWWGAEIKGQLRFKPLFTLSHHWFPSPRTG